MNVSQVVTPLPDTHAVIFSHITPAVTVLAEKARTRASSDHVEGDVLIFGSFIAMQK
jgi:hypothetical protein